MKVNTGECGLIRRGLDFSQGDARAPHGVRVWCGEDERRRGPASWRVVRSVCEVVTPPARPEFSTSLRRTAGMTPEPQCLATGGSLRPASRRRGLIPAVQIHGAETPDVSAQAPRLPVTGASAPGRPKAAVTPWRPSPPLEWHPAGRNFGKEGATPSIRPCPRKPFARDPVQRGGSERSIVRSEGAGISGGYWCRTEHTTLSVSSLRRQGPSFAPALSRTDGLGPSFRWGDVRS